MYFTGKIASIALSTILGIGGIGAASAAFSPDSQPDIKNQIPVVSTDVSQSSDITTMQDDNRSGSIATISTEQMKKLHDNWLEMVNYGLETKTSDLYEKMVQQDQQLMQNVTREQMMELDREWMEQNKTMHRNWGMMVTNGSSEDNKDLYERMVELDQQMMMNVTPEHFSQLDTAWMKQFNPQNQVAPTVTTQKRMEDKATTTPSSSITKQGINHDMEDQNVHASHENTNNNHNRKDSNHQRNMNWGHN